MKTTVHIPITITRTERGEDGRLYAEGMGATTNPVAFTHRSMPGVKFLKFTRAFFEKGMPAYFNRKPKVRVNHSAPLGSGGSVVKYEITDAGVFIRAQISKNVEQDVEDGHYSEFSIGATVTRTSNPDKNGVAEGQDGAISEFSVVDQGADEGCPFTISRVAEDGELELEPEPVEVAHAFMIPRDKFTLATAKEWGDKRSAGFIIELEKDFFCVRRDKTDFDEGSLRTIAFGKGGIKAVIGRLKGDQTVAKSEIGTRLKRMAEEIKLVAGVRDLAPVVERGMGTVHQVIYALECLIGARAQELYEEAAKGGEGGSAAKFWNSIIATAELAMGHLLEEIMEVMGNAPALAENVSKDENLKRADGMATLLLGAATGLDQKAWFSEVMAKRLDDCAAGLAVLREKKKEDEETEDEGGSFHEEMAAHHAAASKIHADYAKDEKDEKAKGYHDGMAAHHSAVSTSYLNEAKRGAKTARAAEGAPGIVVAEDPAVKTLVTRMEAVEKAQPEAFKAVIDRVATVEAWSKQLEGMPTGKVLVDRLTVAEAGLKKAGEDVARLDKFLTNRPGATRFGGGSGTPPLPLDRAAGDKDQKIKRVMDLARQQVAYQAVVAEGADSKAVKTARVSLDYFKAQGMHDARIKDCTTWEAAEKILAAPAA